MPLPAGLPNLTDLSKLNLPAPQIVPEIIQPGRCFCKLKLVIRVIPDTQPHLWGSSEADKLNVCLRWEWMLVPRSGRQGICL